MNTTAPNSKTTNATALQTNEQLRDFIAAMPIVIFAKALRSALQRRGRRAHAVLQTAR
jgi:hypothetical protein